MLQRKLTSDTYLVKYVYVYNFHSQVNITHIPWMLSFFLKKVLAMIVKQRKTMKKFTVKYIQFILFIIFNFIIS